MSTVNRKPIVGIDLGTCTCEVAVVENGEPVVVPPDLYYPQRDKQRLTHPGRFMPSAFCNRGDDHVVGMRAYKELTGLDYPDDVVLEVKRYMREEGRQFAFRSGGKRFSPAEISGHYIQALVGA